MAGVLTTYVPTFQGLSATDLVRPVAAQSSCYPFGAPGALYFYRARNAIYHLFTALASHEGSPHAESAAAESGYPVAPHVESGYPVARPFMGREPLTVLVPDYNSGNEVAAIEAAGASLRYYPLDERGTIDVGTIECLCDLHRPDVLYVIHYLGWPQPIEALAGMCRQRGIWLVEDCALSLLSDARGRALGAFGDWSVFCLYKTLPVPNGSVLVQNTTRLESLTRLPLRDPGPASVLGRTAELMVQRVRSRTNVIGTALQGLKRGLGRAAGAMDVERAKVGDIGFDLADVDLRMSSVSERLLKRLDFRAIRRRRAANWRQLAAALDGGVRMLHPELPEGTCPLFLPILVRDKPQAAAALRERGVDALEFWNHGVPASDAHQSANAQFLRAHVLGLPIHQDLTARHIAHMAEVVLQLQLEAA